MKIPIFNNYESVIDNIEGEVFKIGNKEKINFCPMGFDIETSTIYKKDDNGKVIEHFSFMYCFQYSINDVVLMGRTWQEFSNLIKLIEEKLCPEDEKTICFICNQSFEFSFMGKELLNLGHDVKVFARKKRKPMKIIIDEKLIFLDTYMLTNMGLSSMARAYCKTQKVKDYDYNLIILPKTPLTKKQLKYTSADVLILSEYAIYYKEKYLVNKFMPMTSTMIANRIVKDKVKQLKAKKQAYYLVQKGFPKNFNQYNYIMSFYCGAYTHGNCRNLFITSSGNGKGLLKYDVVSEYPFELMSSTEHYYPMGKYKRFNGTEEMREKILETKCCLIDVTFKNLKTTTGITILSKNKVLDTTENLNNDDLYTWDNGRCYSAKKIRVRICEVDLLKILPLHYDWEEIEYNDMIYCERGTLPDYYVLSLADLYKDKQKYKELAKKDSKYTAELRATKSSFNGQYGALCTRLTETEISFSSLGWSEGVNNIEFEKMPQKKITLCQWAIYCTAWARYWILSTIYKVINLPGCSSYDYYYSDTDSCVFNDKPQIRKFFEELNNEIREKNKEWIDFYNLDNDVDYAEIGTFELEHDDIKRFKCLGSKRYLTEYDNGKIECTVAGLPKKSFIRYCQEKHLEPFSAFKDELLIDCVLSDKLTTYYCDTEVTKTVTDYQGRTQTITSQSYVSLIPTTFKLTVSDTLKALNINLTKFRDEETMMKG